jgi:hypothetical protein
VTCAGRAHLLTLKRQHNGSQQRLYGQLLSNPPAVGSAQPDQQCFVGGGWGAHGRPHATQQFAQQLVQLTTCGMLTLTSRTPAQLWDLNHSQPVQHYPTVSYAKQHDSVAAPTHGDALPAPVCPVWLSCRCASTALCCLCVSLAHSCQLLSQSSWTPCQGCQQSKLAPTRWGQAPQQSDTISS